ncbi:MAG: response regulator [Thermodesulfobacteriota bacterium]
MMSDILFVDDERKVLDGLRRMLADMSGEWRMSFADGGPAALEIMAAAPADVIVTDMRMPGMDGADLLHEVRKLYPGTIRLVLSGYAEKEYLGRAFPPSHQFLSKPCPRDLLVSTIRNALQSRNLLQSTGLRALVGSINRLPSLPELYRQVSRELASDSPSLKKLGDIIRRDVAMTARLLKLVNSPFFGATRKIVDPAQAVNLVGAEYLQSLVMAFATFDACEVSIPDYSLRRLLEHSLRTSCAAERIAALEGTPEKALDVYRTAGLLHDMGKLILASNLAEEYSEIIGRVQRESRPVHEVEREVLGATHAEMGAYLLRLWGLPDSVVEAALLHHAPCTITPGLDPALAVYCANILDREMVVLNPGYHRPPLDLAYLRRAGLDQHLDLWRKGVRDVCARIEVHEA